jgi:RNA polymerase sigma factor (sigma-70 family)
MSATRAGRRRMARMSVLLAGNHLTRQTAPAEPVVVRAAGGGAGAGAATGRTGVGDDQADQLAAAMTSAMAAGDGGAVEAFYRRYFDRLYAEARRATRRDESFCLDVVQESVLRIVRTVRGARSEIQLVAWLRLVVRTTAYDLMRSERRRQRREALAAIGPADETPDEPHAGDEEQLAWLRAQLDRLDPEIARMIDLRYHRRWTLERIARQFGLSIGTVDGRLRRALRRLRESAPEELSDDA